MMIKAISFVAVFGLTLVAFGTAGPAYAHHVMDGQMPVTFLQGLLSGIGHPVIGLDHFAFIIGVGLLAAYAGWRFLLPLTFIAGTLMGAALHFGSLDLFFNEVIIALSVLGAGALIIFNQRPPALLLAGIFALAGLFHGYAYAESIIGAEQSPLIAYLIGFALIQYAVAASAGVIYARLAAPSSEKALAFARITGGVIAGIALVFLSNAALAG